MFNWTIIFARLGADSRVLMRARSKRGIQEVTAPLARSVPFHGSGAALASVGSPLPSRIALPPLPRARQGAAEISKCWRRRCPLGCQSPAICAWRVPAPCYLHDKDASCWCICCLEVLARIKKAPWGAEAFFPPWKDLLTANCPGDVPLGNGVQTQGKDHLWGGRAKLSWKGKKVTFITICRGGRKKSLSFFLKKWRMV